MLRYAEVGRYDTPQSPLIEDRAISWVHAESAGTWPSQVFRVFSWKAARWKLGAVSDLIISKTTRGPRHHVSLPPGETMAATLSGLPVGEHIPYATESYLPGLEKPGRRGFSSNMSKTVVKIGEMLAAELETRYRPRAPFQDRPRRRDRVGAYYRSGRPSRRSRQVSWCGYLVDVRRDSQPGTSPP